MCSESGPFRVEPPGKVVVPANGGCRTFGVEYVYGSGAPRPFAGYVSGAHRLAGAGGNEERLTLALGCAATKVGRCRLTLSNSRRKRLELSG